MDLSSNQRLVFIVADVLCTISLIIYAFGMTDRRLKKVYQYFVISIIYISIDAFVYFNIDINQVYIFVSFFLAVVTLYIISREWVKSLIMSVFWILFGILSEVVSVYLISFTEKGRAEDVLNDNARYTVISCLARFLLLILALTYYSISKRDKATKKTPAYWGIVVSIYAGSIFIIETFYNTYHNYVPSDENYKLLIIVIILIVINILIFFLYEQQAKYFAVKEDIKQLHNHIDRQRLFYDNEKEMWERESMERHDMKNYFISLVKHIDDGDYDMLKEAIHEKINILNAKTRVISSGNRDIDVILNYKIADAIEKGIKVETHFDIVNTLNMVVEDMVVLLGNALDNAVEAAVKTENPYIRIEIGCSRGILDINISNTFKDQVHIDSNMLIKSTKNQQGHGWGIKSMKKIVDKYDGTLIMSSQDNMFTLHISIFV